MRTRELTPAEKYYVDNHAAQPVRELAKFLSTSMKSVQNYLDGREVPAVKQEENVVIADVDPDEVQAKPRHEDEAKDEEAFAASRKKTPLENTRFGVRKGSVVMTGSQSMRDDDLPTSLVGKSLDALREMHGDDIIVTNPNLPVS